MRTTLDIDDAVLAAARSLAAREGITLGAAVSELARRGFAADVPPGKPGLLIFPAPASGHLITDELVAEHRDD